MTLVTCIGHSLGAQTCGHLGRRMGEQGTPLYRTYGLDPAGPEFQARRRLTYLDVHHIEFDQFTSDSTKRNCLLKAYA